MIGGGFLDVFISIFGIIVYSFLIADWNWKRKEDEKEIKDHIDVMYNVGEAIIASKDEEKEVEQLILSRDQQLILKDIESDLKDIFGKDYQSKFILSPIYKKTEFNISGGYWAKQLILSRSGKVGCSEYYNGFPLGRGREVSINTGICLQIEKNLNSYGRGIKLVKSCNNPLVNKMVFKVDKYNCNNVSSKANTT